VRISSPVLLEGCTENLDPGLEPLLGKKTFTHGNYLVLQFGTHGNYLVLQFGTFKENILKAYVMTASGACQVGHPVSTTKPHLVGAKRSSGVN
jgi:hypothetical protein